MTDTRATVVCPACEYEEAFEKLQHARAELERHRREAGHDPRWELAPLASGVERAGAAAGACRGDPQRDDDARTVGYNF